MKQYYNQSAPRRDVKFKVGDYVYMQNSLTKNREPSIILEVCSEPRSYVVGTGNSILRRNEIFIQPRSNNLHVYQSMQPVLDVPRSETTEPSPVQTKNVINEVPV